MNQKNISLLKRYVAEAKRSIFSIEETIREFETQDREFDGPQFPRPQREDYVRPSSFQRRTGTTGFEKPSRITGGKQGRRNRRR